MKYKMILALLAASILSGCGDSDKKLDGEIVKTKDGRYFLVVHSAADAYFIRELDADKLKSDAEFVE